MTENDQALVRIRDLWVSLPPGADRPHAVERIDLDIRAGEIFCMVGESGSGKSITALALMGLLPKPALGIVRGSIAFDGVDLVAAAPEQMRRLRGTRMSMIFQEPMAALNPIMRVGDQIAEALDVHGVGNRRERNRRVIELLRMVELPHPELLTSSYPFRLSGGQRQRVMIAMALAHEPSLLIADEPTTALDVTTQAQILTLIRKLQSDRQMGVLFITHDFGVVAEIADRVAVMQDGRIVEIGAASTVLNRPRHAYTRKLISAVPRPRPGSPARPGTGDEILKVTRLNKSFTIGRGLLSKGRRLDAASAISFTLKRGCTTGLVGESGSGKSTVGRCITRLIEPDSGEVSIDGENLQTLSGRALKAGLARLQMVFQDPYGSLNPRHKVRTIVTEGPIARGVRPADALARMTELLRLVGLDPSAADRYPHEFSGGQRQRIGVARALAMDPEILIADEPVSALDVSVQAQILDLLGDIRRRLNLAVLFITHDLRVAAQVCDEIAVMQRGRIVEFGPTHETFARPRHAYTRQLLDSVPGKHWTPPSFDTVGEASDQGRTAVRPP